VISDEVNSGMAKTMAQRMSFNNMNTEIENAICIQTSNKETTDINTEYGTALATILPILFLYLNTVTVTAGTFEP
jgi:hypothetical protein